MNETLKNPLIPGFYPDPSICRVGDDFYMVTSSFVFYPGIPIFHSRDLMNWTQLGYVLNRPEQLPLDPEITSGGIFAPTIRYHDGVFYVIVTNVAIGNFIVTTKVPEGPWSAPHWIDGAEGIDPSLFWDDDGKAYYTGTTGFGSKTPGIWISEIDLTQFCLVGEKTHLWSGALIGCHSPEAPHIYKKDGMYYLMIAEGGTEVYHAVTIARSQNVKGPYAGYSGNPILTHRHLCTKYSITNVGHGDLIELKDGSWYIVVLASRIYGGYHKNLGRETFIAPVEWENGWPVVSPGSGRIEWSYPGPRSLLQFFEIDDKYTESEVQTNGNDVISSDKAVRVSVDLNEEGVYFCDDKTVFIDDFSGEKLKLCWNFIGTPDKKLIKLDHGLKIKTVAEPICPPDGKMISWMKDDYQVHALGFVGRRQQHMSFEVQINLTLKRMAKETAGMILLQNSYQSVRMELAEENQKQVLRLVSGYIQKEFAPGKRMLDTNLGEQQVEWAFEHNTGSGIYHQEIEASLPWNDDYVTLNMIIRQQDFNFYAIDSQGQKHILKEHMSGGFLGSETAGGCIGTYIGMFASGNGTDIDNYASFSDFKYCPL